MSETIRVKYMKKDEVKYVGHLDTMRTFLRCIKRTNIPVSYSKGFNPRIQISFALPLGVGVTSDCEYFDLTLDSKMNIDMFLSELNSTLPDGFRAISASYPNSKKSLMSLVKEAVYIITINNDIDMKIIENMLEQPELILEKKTDKGVTYKNLKDGILDYSIDSNVIIIHVTAGSNNNINPNSVIEAINSNIGGITDYDICRKELILSE